MGADIRLLPHAVNCVRFCFYFLALSVTSLFVYEMSWEPLNAYLRQIYREHVVYGLSLGQV